MGWTSSRLLYCFWFAFVLPPPRVLSFTAIYSESETQGRKFGGYRIAPKGCKDLTAPGKGPGVCMFNYECTKKNGTVVGSCMDGFLFGACCRLPPGTNFVTMDLSLGSVTQRTSTAPHIFTSSTGSSTVHGPSETILFHENGTVANEVVRPEDFEFNSKPEFFVATDATPPPPNRMSTNQQKSTMWKSTTESWQTTKLRPGWTSLSEDNFVEIPTISAGAGSATQDSDSINHILSILEDTNPAVTPQKEVSPLYTTGHSTQTPLSTWVSVDSKTPNYHTTTPIYSSIYTSVHPTIYMSPTTHHTSQYYTQSSQSSYYTPSSPPSTKPSYATHKPQYSTYKPQYDTTSKPTTSYSTSRPDLYYTVESQHLQYNTEKPLTTYSIVTSSKPTTYTQKPANTVYTKKPSTAQYTTVTKKPSYSTITKKPTTTTQYVQGPGFQVSITPKPAVNILSTPEPAPTVIVLGPVHRPTKKPVQAPIGTIITVNPEGDVVTYKPAAAATAKPIYHGVSHGPLFTTLKPEVTTLGTTGAHKPHPSYVTTGVHRPHQPQQSYGPTQVIKDNLQNTTELFAFPPVRDPYANLSQTYPPEMVHWHSQSTNAYEEDETTPPLVEDENLDNKVHKFVEKIVQSLQGNFEDLENVLIEGESTNNVTVSSYAPPVKRPSTTKKPSKKPTKKPATTYVSSTNRPRPTLPLITRPPPRPSTTKRPYPTKRPSVQTTTIFLDTDTYQTSDHTHTSTHSTTYPTTEVDYKRGNVKIKLRG